MTLPLAPIDGKQPMKWAPADHGVGCSRRARAYNSFGRVRGTGRGAGGSAGRPGILSGKS